MTVASAKPGSKTRRVQRVEARLSIEQKRRIEHAADLKHTSVSDFIVSSADEAATRTIKDHGTWELSGRDAEAFVNAILNPPEPNALMKAAAERYKTLIRSI